MIKCALCCPDHLSVVISFIFKSSKSQDKIIAPLPCNSKTATHKFRTIISRSRLGHHIISELHVRVVFGIQLYNFCMLLLC